MDLVPRGGLRPSQSVLVEEVLSQGAVGFGRGDASQAAHVVAQLLDGVVAVGEEVLLQEVAQLGRADRQTCH